MKTILTFGLLPLFLFNFVTHGSMENTKVQKQRGVSWVAGPREVSAADFAPLVANHVNWIVQTPFGWQRDFNSTHVKLVTDGFVFWGERDVGLQTTTRIAKSLGIKTLLKPHIWLQNSSGGKWRGEISMDNETDWQMWFANYKRFILHYAELAQENGIEALAVGTELYTTAVTHEQEWRDLIAEVRKIYHGKLTYSANWYKEFEEIRFWDALDFIGIQGYFPLTEKEHPSLQDLKAGWQPHLQAIERVSRHFGKPVLFTEMGYRSSADTAIRPWEWPGRWVPQADAADLQTQATCYEAFFQTFWEREWCAGVYFWKWFPGLKTRALAAKRDFTPQNKPAEQVMAKWFGRSTTL